MNIQVVSLRNVESVENFTFSKFSSPRSFDNFDINIIDLNNIEVWDFIGNHMQRDYGSSYVADFRTLGGMVANTNEKVIILLPKNFEGELDIKNNVEKLLNTVRLIYSSYIDIIYGPTITELNNVQVNSDFVFNKYFGFEKITESKKGNKATTVSSDNVIMTTIALDEAEYLGEFLIKTKLINMTNECLPEWMEDIRMFNDNEQFEIIQSKEQEISELREKISDAETILKENNRLKSILYTQSDELVEVVFEIFEELLDIDLSGFEDKKIEDMSFEVDGKVFVGEIKGITSNVKTTNLSQLDHHYTLFMEDKSEYENKEIYRLLIINHQRTKAILDREPIHENQIKSAIEKYKILIIETNELLKLLERYRSNILTKVDIIKLFTGVGVLKI